MSAPWIGVDGNGMVQRDESPVSSPKQAVPQSAWRSPTQSVTIVVLIIIVGVIIGALYLAQATVTATTGSELIALVRTRDFLQRANGDTLSQIALKRNVNTLRGRAQELGFHLAESSDIEYIVVPGYQPIRATPTPQITAVPTPTYDDTFTGWVQQVWNSLVAQFEQWMGSGQSTPTPR